MQSHWMWFLHSRLSTALETALYLESHSTNTQSLIPCHPRSAASAYTPAPFPAPVPAPPSCNKVVSASSAQANRGRAEWTHGFSFAWKSTASTKTSGKRQGWGTCEAMSVLSAPYAVSLVSQGDRRCQPKQWDGAAQIHRHRNWHYLCIKKGKRERMLNSIFSLAPYEPQGWQRWVLGAFGVMV